MNENESTRFKVDVGNYNGPLDVLLDLAKTQKLIWKIYQLQN